MLGKVGIPVVLLLGLLFIAVGDQVLPDPVGPASRKTRVVLISTLSSWLGRGLEMVPSDSRQGVREGAVDEFTCEASGSCPE